LTRKIEVGRICEKKVGFKVGVNVLWLVRVVNL